MPTKGILTATPVEAEPLIKALGLKAQNDKWFKVYKNDHYILIVSGVGMLNATMATTYLMHHHAPIMHLYNVGIAGSTDVQNAIGSLWLIHKVTHSATSKSLSPDILYTHSLQESTLHCVDRPATKDLKHTTKPSKVHLVDMESFGVCTAAMRFAKAHQVSILKVISDHLLDQSTERLEPHWVKSLITEQIDSLLDFMEQYYFEQKPLLSNTNQKVLEKFLQTIKLSVTQQNALKRYCLYRYLQSKKDFNQSLLEGYLQEWRQLPKA